MATKEEHIKEQTSTKEETSTKEDLASGWHAADQLTLHRIGLLWLATPPHLWRYVEVAKMTCAVCREFHANTPAAMEEHINSAHQDVLMSEVQVLEDSPRTSHSRSPHGRSRSPHGRSHRSTSTRSAPHDTDMQAVPVEPGAIIGKAGAEQLPSASPRVLAALKEELPSASTRVLAEFHAECRLTSKAKPRAKAKFVQDSPPERDQPRPVEPGAMGGKAGTVQLPFVFRNWGQPVQDPPPAVKPKHAKAGTKQLQGATIYQPPVEDAPAGPEGFTIPPTCQRRLSPGASNMMRQVPADAGVL